MPVPNPAGPGGFWCRTRQGSGALLPTPEGSGGSDAEPGRLGDSGTEPRQGSGVLVINPGGLGVSGTEPRRAPVPVPPQPGHESRQRGQMAPHAAAPLPRQIFGRKRRFPSLFPQQRSGGGGSAPVPPSPKSPRSPPRSRGSLAPSPAPPPWLPPAVSFPRGGGRHPECAPTKNKPGGVWGAPRPSPTGGGWLGRAGRSRAAVIAGVTGAVTAPGVAPPAAPEGTPAQCPQRPGDLRGGAGSLMLFWRGPRFWMRRELFGVKS